MPYTLPPGSTAAEFGIRRYGRPVRVAEKFVNVDTSVVGILENNPRRLHWLIQNRSSYNIAVGFDPQVTAAGGWLVAAGGGFVGMDVSEDAEAVGWALYGVSLFSNAFVRVLEIIAE